MIKRMQHKGFTLLEILVAFTMLAVTFATVMQIIAGSSKNTVKASHNTKIALLSQSKFDELGLFEPIEEGSTSGSFDDNTSWVLDIVPFEAPYEGDYNQEFSAVDLMDVTLTVTTEIGNRVETNVFRTLRAITPDYTQAR
ncbi:MAG TPA: type II secretion system protein [Oceanospirillales bacterium]|nr:type II secretion system protein [Oceanospirillales bacterium]